MAGIAATASIAKSAANNINFFNFYPFSSAILAESFTLSRNYTRRSRLLYIFFKVGSLVPGYEANETAPACKPEDPPQRCAPPIDYTASERARLRVPACRLVRI